VVICALQAVAVPAKRWRWLGPIDHESLAHRPSYPSICFNHFRCKAIGERMNGLSVESLITLGYRHAHTPERSSCRIGIGVAEGMLDLRVSARLCAGDWNSQCNHLLEG
jgi:hypothetical protein